MITNRHPFNVIKRGLQYYPSIFPSVYSIMEHVFATNGNGYEPDKDGNLASYDEMPNKPICITDEGLHWLKYDFLKASYHIYPVNSYEYEFKAWGGSGETRFYTDLYHYPRLNEEWKLAARWFMHQIVGRNEKEWKQYFKAKAITSLDFPADWKQELDMMMKARKHFLSFVKRFDIKLDYYECMQWENELMAFLAPERK